MLPIKRKILPRRNKQVCTQQRTHLQFLPQHLLGFYNDGLWAEQLVWPPPLHSLFDVVVVVGVAHICPPKYRVVNFYHT